MGRQTDRVMVVSVIYEMTGDILAAQDSQATARDYPPVLHRARVIAYLRSNEVLAMTSGRIADEYTGRCVEGYFMNCRTDGTYSWGEPLAYHVGEYGILLPSDFLEHIYRRFGIVR